MTASVYIFDCDGVLYPQSELSLKQIIAAMKKVYRDDVGLSGEQQKAISDKTIQKGHKGAFNFIREICETTGYDFPEYCRRMAAETDYSHITHNPELKKILEELAGRKKIFILSNNSRKHIDCVLQAVFHQTAEQIEKKGVVICDIASTLKDGCFHPKQSPDGFGLFLEKAGVKGEDCRLFDDSEDNLKAARRYGIEGYLITPENNLEKTLKKISAKSKIWKKDEQTR